MLPRKNARAAASKKRAAKDSEDEEDEDEESGSDFEVSPAKGGRKAAQRNTASKRPATGRPKRAAAAKKGE